MGDGSALVVYGTPLENSDELSARKRVKALDKGTLRQQQPVWKQDARDSEGRRRFHGAFTGGFSAGYYNTVGSKEGWEPKTFKSSRGSRAGTQQNSAYDYMDEDERKDLDSRNIGTSHEFDTFGFTAAEFARREATQENNSGYERPSIIPGPIPDEIIVPANESIGMKLLRKMGWRQGRAIGPKHVAASSDVRREGRKAMMALASGGSVDNASEFVPDTEEAVERDVPSTTPSFVKKPKENVYGLGFDPYKSAPEFREAKKSRANDSKKDKPFSKPSMFRPGAGTMSQGFGIGALEEMGEEDEDVYGTGPRPEKLVFEEEDDFEQPDKKPKKVSMPKLPDFSYGKDGLPGFKFATASEKAFQAEWFHAPVVPPDFVPVHKFVSTLDSSQNDSDAPPETPPPDDKVLVKLIDGLAVLVARSGVQFEALSKEKHKENPLFQFLFGGLGSDYYLRRLWEERSKRGLQTQSRRDVTKLSASERGQVLGEAPLQATSRPSIPAEDRARLQETLNNTFMKPVSEPSHLSSKPFEDDPAKQARYEQFVKDKYQGGLRKMNRGAQQLTEVQRAQEILEFEAVAHASGGAGSASKSMLAKAGVSNDKFTSGGHEQSGSVLKSNDKKTPKQVLPPVSHHRPPEPSEPSTQYPKRSECSWRPLSLLCKRFDLADPYCGQSSLAKPKSRIDSLTLATPSESLWSGKISEVLAQSTIAPRDDTKDDAGDDDPAEQPEEKEPIEKLAEKPVDLFKAIFSDDEEMEDSEPAAEPEKHVDAANAALTRLVADDFLTSLGKELGLAVPPAVPAPREPDAPKDIPKGHFKFVKPSKGKPTKDESSKAETSNDETNNDEPTNAPEEDTNAAPSVPAREPQDAPKDMHNGSKEEDGDSDTDNKLRKDEHEDERRKSHKHRSREKDRTRKERPSGDESSPEDRRKHKSRTRDESREDRRHRATSRDGSPDDRRKYKSRTRDESLERKRRSRARDESPDNRKRRTSDRDDSPPEDRRKRGRSNRDESPEDRRKRRASSRDESLDNRQKRKRRERKDKERRHTSRKRRRSSSPSSSSS